MRRATLLAMLLWAAPHVATAQATVGDAADEALLPDVEAAADAPEPNAEPAGASEETAPAAQRVEASPDEPAPDEPVPFVHTANDVPEEEGATPLLESAWFWIAIGAVVFGITAAVLVAVTTDDASEPTDPTMMGLTLRF